MTLTLEKDVAAVIERLRKTRRQSMKVIVNEALREGLKQIAAPRGKRGSFELVRPTLDVAGWAMSITWRRFGGGRDRIFPMILLDANLLIYRQRFSSIP